MKAVTERQIAVLLTIVAAAEPPSLADLGRDLGITTRGAHDHVLALERKGLITRRRAGGSAMERAIELTAAGYAAIGAHPPNERVLRLEGLLMRAFEALRAAESAAPLLEDIRRELA